MSWTDVGPYTPPNLDIYAIHSQSTAPSAHEGFASAEVAIRSSVCWASRRVVRGAQPSTCLVHVRVLTGQREAIEQRFVKEPGWNRLSVKSVSRTRAASTDRHESLQCTWPLSLLWPYISCISESRSPGLWNCQSTRIIFSEQSGSWSRCCCGSVVGPRLALVVSPWSVGRCQATVLLSATREHSWSWSIFLGLALSKQDLVPSGGRRRAAASAT